MNIFGILTMIGGLAMFLYGMSVMGGGLEKMSGGKLERILESLTSNPFKAVLLGAGVTAVIQSSSATTVMVVGFVNSGIMKLSQAIGIIMGANIGTTVTSWLLSLTGIESSNFLISMLKPSSFSPVLALIGIIMYMSGKDKKKDIGEILLGFAILMFGMETMSDAVKPLADVPEFTDILTMFNNPVFGVLAGALLTAVIQSSSASVGILQTLAMNGIVTTNAAIYITLGQNIGSCVTAMLSSMGGSRTAKRAAVMHLTFNVIGAIVFGSIGFIFFSLRPAFAASNINAVQISIFHTIFNLSMTTLLFPFADVLVKISGMVVKEKVEEEPVAEDAETAATLKHLDERIFESPAFAVETAALEVVHMGQITYENVVRAIDSVLTVNSDEVETVFKTEQTINNMEKMLTEYLIKVDNLSLTEKQKKVVNNLFYSVSDIERIGDHAENLAEQAQYMVEHGLQFSSTGAEDLKSISDSVLKSFQYAIDARQNGNMEAVRKVSQYEDDVDSQEEELREKHIERLSAGECKASAGVVFLDIISNLERVSDHAYNLAGYVKDEM